MSGDSRRILIELSGDYAEYVVGDASSRGVDESEVVRRAVGLYCVLVARIEAGEQVLLSYLSDTIDLPQLIRLDFYTPPARGTELDLHPDLEDDRHVHAELMAWPPIVE
jgi:hypothetical protein